MFVSERNATDMSCVVIATGNISPFELQETANNVRIPFTDRKKT